MRIRTSTPVVVAHQTPILPAITVGFTGATLCFFLGRDNRGKDSEGREKNDGQRDQQRQEPLGHFQVPHTEGRRFFSAQDIVLLNERIVGIGVLGQVIFQRSSRILETREE